MIYNAQDFVNIIAQTRIIGFSKVKKNDDKVWIWFQQKVKRPSYLDPYSLTRELNNSQRKVDWAKLVGYKDKVTEMLFGQGEFKHINLLDNLTDVWETVSDGSREFKKCIINNPYNSITGQYLNIEIKQSVIEPEDIRERAILESDGDEKKEDELYNKYKKQAILKTYNSLKISNDSSTTINGLVPVKIFKNGEYLDIYEYKYVVDREAEHTFLDYREDTKLYYRSSINELLVLNKEGKEDDVAVIKPIDLTL